MLPEELRNKWIEEIKSTWPGEDEGVDNLRGYILSEKENAYQAGIIDTLKENVKHYRDMCGEDDDYICTRCLLEQVEEDEDEDGNGRDGLPINLLPKSDKEASPEELKKLGKMWEPKDKGD